MYERDEAEVYDLLHAHRGKDHEAEAAALQDLVRELCPAADSLLDVACGTGRHLAVWSREWEVEGVDVSAAMLDRARQRLPGVPLHLADMRELALGRTFSAVTCMFSSVGHLADTNELDTAVSRMADHVRVGGLLVVEPWWTPEQFLPGYVAHDTAEPADGGRIVRASHSTRVGSQSRVEVHHLVVDDSGIRHFADVHLITLFTAEDYRSAFSRAGLTVSWHPGVAGSAKGLWLGRRDPT